VGEKGTHLYLGGFRNQNLLPASVRSLDTNSIANLANNQVSNPFFGYITDPLSTLSGPTVPQFQLLLPFPQFSNFSGDSPPIANSIYHDAQFRIEKGFSNSLQFLVTYTVSKSIDNASATTAFLGWVAG
jgi:hypothetical protein